MTRLFKSATIATAVATVVVTVIIVTLVARVAHHEERFSVVRASAFPRDASSSCPRYGKIERSTFLHSYDPYVDLSNHEFQPILNRFARERHRADVSTQLAHQLLKRQGGYRAMALGPAVSVKPHDEWLEIVDAMLPALNAYMRRQESPHSDASLKQPPFKRLSSCYVRSGVDGSTSLRYHVWYDLLYRAEKSYGFHIQWAVALRAKTRTEATLDIRRARIVGNILQQDIELASGAPASGTRIDIPVQSAHNNSILFPETRMRQMEHDRADVKLNSDLAKQFVCVDQPQYTRKLTCLSNRDEFGRPKIPGTWDRPCVSNEECPFFKKNQNYPNERGGCIGGKCEMPINIRRVGFRQFDAKHKPFCHNCRNVGYKCCAEQMLRRDPAYSQMVSPDYVFSDDQIPRLKYASDLALRGMVENPKIALIVPLDVYDDYVAFVGRRDPRVITDFYGTRRDVAELILVQQALYIGGNTTKLTIEKGDLSYLSIKDMIALSDTIHISGTTVWRVDFVDSRDDVFLSDPMVRQGEFEAGIYVKSTSAHILNRNHQMKPKNVRDIRFVSSKQWSVDWRTLQDLAPRALYDTPQWGDMTKMVFEGTVDALLAPFQSTTDLRLDIVGDDGVTRTMLPVQGYKIGLSGARHFAVANNPGSKRVLLQLNNGIKQMRKDKLITRAYKECGFFNTRVAKWIKLP